MAIVPQPGHRSNLGLNAGVTYFWAAAQTAPSSGQTEANTETPFRKPGVLSNFAMYVTANDRGASTARVRKNGANGNGVISVGASGTGLFEDVTNTDTVATGDKMGLTYTPGTGGTATTLNGIDTHFAAATDTTTKLDVSLGVLLSTASQTLYAGLCASNSPVTTESDRKTLIRVAGVWSGLYVAVPTNTSTNATTFRTRINGANGAQTLSVPGSTTGFFEDTTHSDTIAAGDLLCFQIVTGAGTVNFGPQNYATDFTTATASWPSVCNATIAGLIFGLTRFAPIGGQTGANAVEANQSTKVRIVAKWSNLWINVTANTLNGSTTVLLRKGAANTAVTLSVPTATTGTFEDTTHSVNSASGDLMAIAIITGGSSGAITYEATTLAAQAITYSSGYVY